MSFLKELSVVIGLMGSDVNPVADAGGWKNFVWRVAPYDQCIEIDDRGFCIVVESKWDWKREQYYRFGFRLNPDGMMIARLRLENKDVQDTDNVCVVALFVDGEGKEVGFIYQNWPSLKNRTIDREIRLVPAIDVAKVRSIAVGTKQCRKRNPEDSQAFRALRQRLIHLR